MNAVCLCCLGCLYSFGLAINFVVTMRIYVDVLNTKVADNFLILLVLKFHDFKPDGLDVIDFTSLLSTFAYAGNISE